MSILYMLIGLPSSGKSAWAEKKIEENKDIKYISSDKIREVFLKDINNQLHNETVFEIAHTAIKSFLKHGNDVVFDATNLSRRNRINLIKQLPDCEIKAILFAIPFEICCSRNDNRERTVPYEAMLKMYRSFEPPHYAEGFDTIDIISYNTIYPEDTFSYLEYMMEKNISCPHDNPNHTLSCGEHCLKAYSEIMTEENMEKYGCETLDLLATAARYHDLSKYKCKTFYNMKGNLTEKAHYYFHEHLSAYDYLCYEGNKNSVENNIFIDNLIANHMVFFKGEKAIRKIKELYGEYFFKCLETLHEADIAAH